MKKHSGPFKKARHPYFQRRFEVHINSECVEVVKNYNQRSDFWMLTNLRDKYLNNVMHEFRYEVFKIVPSVFPDMKD